ncbi:hypothetical protein [Roseiconus lacunae]|uniref:HEPN domain-containing protein n=1 Tax=Roseiconus lacunae TaxID=2605694 RepID=A0ABT7PDP9_9BACT|nr:hypothetical protein [Roseiconus lacunae]MDM4014624.1 hypothetical protein [Roseiconus lacunae]
MKTKARSPFESGDDHTNACVGFMHDMSCGYIEGYRLAAGLLATHVETQNDDHDFLVYPICYLYRHHLELQIKQIIRTGRRLLDKDGDSPAHHKLADLWPLAKGLIREAVPNQPDPPEFRALDLFIDQFATVDYDAQAFRFPTKSKSSGGGRSLDGVTHISLTGLRDAVEPLASFLSGCDAWLSEMLEFKYEMQREYGP